jgi:plasmid stabilization system protein ParE
MDLRFGAAAKYELIKAAEFYDQQYRGLGDAFLDEVNQYVSLLIENPHMGRRIRIDRRSVILRRFPYRLVYTLDDIDIRIIAVAHQRQRPGYWGERVEEAHPRYVVLSMAA